MSGGGCNELTLHADDSVEEGRVLLRAQTGQPGPGRRRAKGGEAERRSSGGTTGATSNAPHPSATQRPPSRMAVAKHARGETGRPGDAATLGDWHRTWRRGSRLEKQEKHTREKEKPTQPAAACLCGSGRQRREQ